MVKKAAILLLLTAGFLSQGNAQSTNNFEAINEVWGKFYQAFATLDYRPMAEIHSKRLVRVSGDQTIRDYDTYMSNYRNSFDQTRKNGETNEISLRFFERINNDSVASERGIYKLIRNKGRQSEQAYYGQFHVIFIKEGGEWKILMDYDSSEGGTIGEDDYVQSHGITDYDHF